MGLLILFIIIIMPIIFSSIITDNSSSSSTTVTYSHPRKTYSRTYSKSYVYKRNNYNKRIERWKKKREEFEAQKETDFFKEWKREQYKSQSGRCAWCQKEIELYSPETHTDHIKPLMWWGTNEYTNLVLSCKECNKQKGDSTTGWNGAKGVPGENSKPSWIRTNRCCRNFELKKA